MQYKTRNEIQCNAMGKKTMNQGEWYTEDVMSERFVAVSMVTRSRIRGCFPM